MVKLEEVIKLHAEGINRTPEEFKEAVEQSGMRYNNLGELCNIVDGKLIPAESQTTAIHLVYERIRQEIMNAGEGTAPGATSGVVDLPEGDGGPTTIIRKVDVPTALENLARKLNRPSAVAEAALEVHHIFCEGYAFYKEEGGKKVLVTFEEALGIGRNYFASLAAAGEGRVATPIIPKEDYLRPLAEEFQKPLAELEEVLGKEDYFILEGKGWCRSLAGPTKEGSAKAWLGVPKEEVRDYLKKHYAAFASAESDGGPGEETVELDADAVSEEEDTPSPKEKYLDDLAHHHEVSLAEIEVALSKKGYGLDVQTGEFFHLHLEPNGLLRGETAPISEVNDALGEYFTAEKSKAEKEPPTSEKPVPPPRPELSRDTIPEISEVLPPVPAKPSDGSNNQVADSWFKKEDAIHVPEQDEGLEDKPMAEVASKTEEGVKRHWSSYVAGGVAGILAIGGIFMLGYVTKSVVGEPTPTVSQMIADRETIAYLKLQLSEVKSELEGVYADNEGLVDENYIEAQEHEICVGERGVLSADLEYKKAEYVSLEQQLASAPTVQEVLALKQGNAELEVERDAARAERDGAVVELGECQIAAGTPTIEYVDREVPVEVEKECPSVECPPARECPTVACPKVTECPSVQCPPAAECPSAEIVCQSVQQNYAACQAEKDTAVRAKVAEVKVREETVAALAACVKEKDLMMCPPVMECPGAEVLCQDVRASYASETQAREEADDLHAICEADKEFTQVAYDTCVGELKARGVAGPEAGDVRYAAIKMIVESDESSRKKTDALLNLLEGYIEEAGGDIAIAASGSCTTGLSNLYALITSVKDSSTANDFKSLLAEEICAGFTSGSDYLTLKVVDE